MDNLRKNTRSIVWGIMDVIVYFIAIMFVIQLLANAFNYGIDPTDKDGWNRSGLRYYKDHGTGIEYISNGTCIIPRPTTDERGE